MVARIKRTQSLSRSLNYNEKKVEAGVAACIHAVNYPKDVEQLNFYDKLHRLEHLAALNERVKANSVHISLNFAESDQLNKEKLCTIVATYMKGIGFEKQPYLVYEYIDATHPHIHIVSTNIEKDGYKIEMNNIGRNESEKARKAIELTFGLTKAEGRSKKQGYELKVNAQRVQYGKTGTKRAITNVLDAVINNYKYTSLAGLNAILKLYNVIADRGKEGTKMYEKKGLIYTALDDKGNKIGTPIKASAFYSKPILKYLEEKFVQNEVLRQPHKQSLKTRIDWTLLKGDKTLSEFRKALEKEGIQVVLRQNDKGMIYGITYVDFKSKCVFNGSDLGKEYSAKGIVERCKQEQEVRQQSGQVQGVWQTMEGVKAIDVNKEEELKEAGEKKKEVLKGWEELLKPVKEGNDVPYPLLQKKRKKKQNKGWHL